MVGKITGWIFEKYGKTFGNFLTTGKIMKRNSMKYVFKLHLRLSNSAELN